MIDRVSRGWPLTAFLILCGLICCLSITFYAGLYGTAFRSQIPIWVSRVFLAVATLRLLATIAIWCWFKEGVVAFVLLTLVAMPISVSIGYPSAIGSLIGIALLLYLVRDKWGYMRWLAAPANNRWRGP